MQGRIAYVLSGSPEGVPYVSDGHRPSKRRTLTSPERVQYNTLRDYGVYGSICRQLFSTSEIAGVTTKNNYAPDNQIMDMMQVPGFLEISPRIKSSHLAWMNGCLRRLKFMHNIIRLACPD